MGAQPFSTACPTPGPAHSQTGSLSLPSGGCSARGCATSKAPFAHAGQPLTALAITLTAAPPSSACAATATTVSMPKASAPLPNRLACPLLPRPRVLWRTRTGAPRTHAFDQTTGSAGMSLSAVCLLRLRWRWHLRRHLRSSRREVERRRHAGRSQPQAA